MADSTDTAFVLKGRMLTLMVFELYNPNIVQLAMRLKEHMAQAPNLFKNTPLVVDLSPLQDGFKVVDFPALVSLLDNHGLTVVGVVGGNEQQRAAAARARLALFPDSPGQAVSEPSGATTDKIKEAPPVEEAPPTPAASNLVVRLPVRAGQQLYARGGDLIIESSVNEGAEVVADGDIHIYGALRGRALAGARGRSDARIWCQSLEAELVSINGIYRTREDIDPTLLGRPAVIEILNEKMIIRAFG
ncbi:MAG: septum site-determining protein MinC [Gammaproteobacteria bacterium]|nr:septum site-determining protein MinC [Gammaproteobacteria bacterium]